MPLFNSESWSGTATASVVGILIVTALAFAVVGYVEWSSDANLAQFTIDDRGGHGQLNSDSASQGTNRLRAGQ
ncbi:hypothetical protein [Bradyrhizobium sp. 33ap4]|uniref:hypothetical protein n=1 Tax=Bradyrhizobium sp. 33ap4 TaxID=3061630 RepID=UPI002931A8FA|nr:hypothetical protein [Bradyrhizobium sp. 33ap4]